MDDGDDFMKLNGDFKVGEKELLITEPMLPK